MPVENRAQSILRYQSCTELFQHYRLQCNACFHIKSDTHLNTCFDHICREGESQPGGERERAPPSIIMCIRNYMHLLASSNCTPFYFIQTSRTWRERADSKRKKKTKSQLLLLVFVFRTGHGHYYAVYSVFLATNTTFYFRFISLFSFSFSFKT